MRKPLVALIIAVIGLGMLLPIVIITLQKDKNPHHGMTGVRMLLPDGQIKVLDLEQYLVGVVAAEMPASFAPEAIKAQAVAARTYVAQILSQPDISSRHYDVDTTQKTQGWLSDAAMRQRWGIMRYIPYKLRIEKAVQETKGLVLIYGGTYVEAFYFSNAGRLPTEKADDVWGAPLPYLTNVPPESVEKSKFVVSSSFTSAQLDAKLGSSLDKRRSPGPKDVKITERTTAGRAKTVRVGSKLYQATWLRSQLGLKSTDFVLSFSNGKVVFTTYGNGHAVGMSQYGANYLAQEGKNFTAILQHYYPGTKLIDINSSNG
ncbi:MAG: stage II sporulation protein D [Peptococcaceae bacterium]|nr:stage II sporulation protein D [Peptococcaceae bacterium]